MKQEYDVIVVGAGSAGCALAYRLAASSDLNVALLEAGSPARNPLLHIPLGFVFLLKEHSNNWNYYTQPEPYLNNRRIALHRGKVLGGCSAINGMVYVRGQAQDYDRWAALGNPGWGYRDVLPYFKRSEDNQNGPCEYHGSGGPLWVGNVNNEFPICDAFIKAAGQAGIPFNPDINGATQEGAAFFPHNVKHGRRWSAASAFLGAGKSLKNLTVIPYANTHRVLLENQRAVGVECDIRGTRTLLKARREVVLSGGAINSPKLLELSGIGQAERLKAAGIPLVLDLPGVGENLHDHWNCYGKRTIDRGNSYWAETKPLGMMRNMGRYLIKRGGFMANPAALVTAFYRAADDADRPDAQIHFAPGASTVDKRGNMMPIFGITISSCGLRPTSRGSTHIALKAPGGAPDITMNYLQTVEDRLVAVAAFRKVREISKQDALQEYGGAEFEPGNHLQSDGQILEFIRQYGEPVHHAVGSCKMGHDEMAVVDAQLRVRGIEGLRVADASIMPEIISGNTHAPCVMIGEKAADFILKRA